MQNGIEKANKTVIGLKGRIDSNNAAQVEDDIMARLGSDAAVVLDAAALDYISSAGLRVILRVKKSHPDVSIINAKPEVYDILDMTGFTEMMPVERAYKTVSIEGCEEIGRGAYGTVYRMNSDNVVKVYNNADALEDIRHEREVARLALILGIPTAISYDVVKVGDSYGSMFELLNARSFSKIIANEPDKLDWCAREYAELLKKIHGTVVPEGKLPDIREDMLGRARFLQAYLPEETGKKLVALIEGVPGDDHMIHGDYHTKNLELQGDEVLLIDMDTLAVGRPIFEFGPIFNSFMGFSEIDHSIIKQFQGFDYETGTAFFHKALAAYLGTECPDKLIEAEEKARILGYMRLIRRAIKNGESNTENGAKELEFRKKRLIELVDKYDKLDLDPNEIIVDAVPEKLPEVLAFVGERLGGADCGIKTRMQIELAVEEMFVNIANYAYAPGSGKASVRAEVLQEPACAKITLTDGGRPYDPLKAEQPDITLSAAERQPGGLGIFLTLKSMDEVSYGYNGGKNVLTLKKYL